MTHVGHSTRHHPLCPRCRYDLVAAVDTGRNICPECGFEFDRDELRNAVLPGDWTMITGVRNALISLILRSLLAGAVWAGALAGLLSLPKVALHGRLTLLVAVGLGVLVGLIVSRRLVDHAGFAGAFLTSLAGIFAISVIVGSTAIVSSAMGPIGGHFQFVFCGCGCVGAMGAIVWFTIANA